MSDMNMSFFEKAKLYYDNGVWSKTMLRQLVSKGKLTIEQYKTITGESF